MIWVNRPIPSQQINVEIVAQNRTTKETVRYFYHGELPKEFMDAYQEIVGNAQAKVSVSADMGKKEFGNGPASTVFITLACNQDQTSLLRAIDLAGSMARWAVKDQLGKTESEFQQMLAKSNQGLATTPNYG